MEALRTFPLIAKYGDYGVSFDLKDIFFSLAIAPHDTTSLTSNKALQLLQF
jgi:hypothetical protein